MLILIRYGEIGLKSNQVRVGFEEQLKQNLSHLLDANGVAHDIVTKDDRIFASVSEDDAADAALLLSRVPGVVSVSPVKTTTLDQEALTKTALQLLTDTDAETFAVRARRAGDQHPYTSKELEQDIGQAIVDTYNLDVDLDHPDITVYIEARYTQAYLYTVVVEGVGGLPVSEDRPVVVLMKDRASTVAAYQLMKRGCKVYPVYPGQEAEKLSQDIEMLRQFDPDVKLTVMKGKDAATVIDQACELFGCAAAAVPDTAADLPGEALETAVQLLRPNAGMADDEVLELYHEIQPLPP